MTVNRSGATITSTVNYVLASAKHYSFTIELTLYGPNLPQNITIHPDFINEWQINHNFVTSYAPEEMLSFKVTVWEYITLLRGYQDLKANLIVNYANHIYGTVFKSIPPFIFDYRAIIENAENILKDKSIYNLLPTPGDTEDVVKKKQSIQLDLNIQLINDTVYELRHPKLNGILDNSTVEDAINFFTQAFDIDNVKMVPPDNAKIIENLVIPPFQGFDSILQTLHKDYGLYLKGVSHFYMLDTLFIYPAAETELSFHDSLPIHVYKINESDYVGLEAYSNILNGALHIVTSQAEGNISSTEKSKENNASGLLMMDANKLIDEYKESTSLNTTILEDSLQYLEIDNPRNLTQSSQNIKFTGPIANPTYETSKIVNNQADQLSVLWATATFDKIYPKNPVTYHYENADGYQIQQGVVNGVVYTIKKVSKPLNTLFRCNAGLILSLTPLSNF
jgi:hypothetical protein